MSQQGPGGYGGGYGGPPGGGYGGPPGGPPGGAPPGGYGPPGGAPPGGYGPPGGAPPGGYGPPGGARPGGYGPGAPPPGYGPQPGYPAPGAGAPPKKSKAPLFIGLGCGAIVLIGAGVAIVLFLYTRSKVHDAERAIAGLTAEASAGIPGIPTPSSASAVCQKAIACCKLVTGKASAVSPLLVAQGCNGLGLLADAQCTQQYASLKRSAAAIGATCE